MTKEERKVILASSLGTVFEWYDFYLYGSLAAFIGAQFFTPFPETSRNIFALLAFAAGFIVRPFGALVFGMLGDLVGRKYTFLMTILIMGLSTFLVGILPGYASWGIAAPICLIVLRMLQGLALGGEYGGAAVYVAEHAPEGRRGFYTSWIQTTATLGLFLSLAVILIVTPIINNNFPSVVQLGLDGMPLLDAKGAEVSLPAWNAWGWRVPFILSAFLLLVSLYIRLTMSESPVYQKMKAEGAASKAPLREAFGTWKNGKIAIIALLGLTAGQAVVWYGGQFYALSFLQSAVKVDFFTANVFVLCSLVLGTWGFLFFGSLSDKIGRKPIILAGCAIAALTYFPVFQFITKTANPALHAAHQTKITVTADPENCSFQFNPVGTAKFTNSCDIAKALLLKASANSETVDAAAGSVAMVKIGETEIAAYDGAANAADIAAGKAAVEAAKTAIDPALVTALTGAEKAAAAAKVVLADAEKALAGAADDAKAAAQTAVDAAKAAMPATEAALAAARAAIPADQLAALDAANGELAKANGVKGAFEKAVNDALLAAGYPIVAKDNTTVAKIASFGDLFTAQNLSVIIALTYLIILVTMVYGPIAAQLVELYPTRIRYSGMSLPYHIGNGWFGGLLPATVLAISAQYGNIYSGLWYPIIVAVMTVVVGTLLVPNGTHKKSIFAE
ncbi:MFS transporter [Rhodobacteraceae bacterium CYK-10]|uniref:MFS transporter n=2 Tax=Stagnihabitans tardus TaxID=2699202 RepID=A0AAE4YAA8_9RHOB|nr:MFS transporter [Stagnihabitans tardus]